MKYLLTLATKGINNFYNYASNTSSSSDTEGYILIFILIIGVSIYAALYIPIKLYQINKNTKLIRDELIKINHHLSKNDKDIEILEDNNIE